MYQISVELDFDAAHALRGYKGKCEALHGHRFVVVVKIKASKLNDIGIAYDFADLKKHANEIIDRFDHSYLNEIPPFDKINPSSENIAYTIYNELKPKLAGSAVSLSVVEVWESPQSGATYSPD
jgi:6-pyruvoyltetrahydropterin/6-carboxytetrahydropterin synthase